MAYIPPSKRNIKKEEITTPTKPTVVVCKWCHERDHLSISCQYKGCIQEKRPELSNTEVFPSLAKKIEVNNEDSIWNTNFKLDEFKEQISKISNGDLKRIGSSAASLDTLTSNYSELDIDEIDSMIHQNDSRLIDIHPYKSFYKSNSKQHENLFTNDFNQYYYIYLDHII